MKRKIGLLLICLIMLVGCESQDSSTVISAGSIVENQQIQDELNKAQAILTEKERFEKDYGTGGYLNDNTEVQERLNKEAYDYYKAYFEVNAPNVEYFLVNIDLFHSYYKIVKEENLSYKDIAESHVDYIDKVEFSVFGFTDAIKMESDKLKDIAVLNTVEDVYKLEESKLLSDSQVYVIGFIYDNRLEEQFKVKYSTTKIGVILQQYMSKTNVNSYNYIISDDLSVRALLAKKDDLYTPFNDTLMALEERYNEKFMFAKVDSPFNLYSSMRNPNLIFEANTSEDRYVAALVEDYIASNVNKTLKEMNVDDKIGVFVASVGGPKDGLDMQVHKDNIKDLADQTNKYMALYYVIGEDEAYDYELMKEVILNTQDHLFNENSVGGTLYVKLFKAKKTDAQSFLKILKENPVTENYIRDGGMGSDWEISFNNSESFKFLDCFGTQENFIYKAEGKIRQDITSEVLFKGIKMKNEYTRWED